MRLARLLLHGHNTAGLVSNIGLLFEGMPMIARALLCACYAVLLSRAAAAQAATDTTRDTTRARAQGVTTSRFTVSGDRLRALPVDDPAQALWWCRVSCSAAATSASTNWPGSLFVATRQAKR